MPYIKPEDRAGWDAKLEVFYPSFEAHSVSAGEMNYIITKLISRWAAKNYMGLALATGVLENVKQEFYRRVAAPYEDGKIAENGDVY